jgi:hypothetical protein
MKSFIQTEMKVEQLVKCLDMHRMIQYYSLPNRISWKVLLFARHKHYPIFDPKRTGAVTQGGVHYNVEVGIEANTFKTRREVR